MPARATWHGVLRLADVRVPVRLYSAVEERGVHFRLLHASDRTPVRQRMTGARTGKEVPRDRLRKAYEVRPGGFVLLTQAELDAAEPEDSREIDVRDFVDAATIEPSWYERPYLLSPGGRSATEYYALADALAGSTRVGIARWVMRDREHTGVLRTHERHLVLITLRHADEVIPRKALGTPQRAEPTRKELELARQLVAALESSFDPARYRDDFRDRVLDFVRAKAKGRRLRPSRVKRPKPPTDLAAALQASLGARARA